MKSPSASPAGAAPAPSARVLRRSDLIQALAAGLQRHDAVLAAWLGGSDANGRADELSDVDLCLITADERVEEAFAAVERTLEALSPISRRFRLPSPTWHGAEQCFYQLRDAPEWLMIDLCVFARSTEHQFFDRARHGDPRVLFDPHNLVRPAGRDPAAHAAAIARRLEELRSRFDLFAHMPAKEARRGRDVDALAFYHSMILRPLVDLLRIRHCPGRFDFSLRYLDADLPPEIAARVKRLAFIPSAAEIPARVDEARALFHATLAEI